MKAEADALRAKARDVEAAAKKASGLSFDASFPLPFAGEAAFAAFAFPGEPLAPFFALGFAAFLFAFFLPGMQHLRETVQQLRLLTALLARLLLRPIEQVTGLSVRPLTEGSEQPTWRESLPLESEIGRMIVTERYKYMLHDSGENREQLIDLLEDPGEMRNVAYDPGNERLLYRYRRLFEEVFRSEQSAAPDRAPRGR